METFKKIATIIGVAIIGYFSFYLLEIIYILANMLFGFKNHDGMAIFMAIIAVVIYLIKSRKKN